MGTRRVAEPASPPLATPKRVAAAPAAAAPPPLDQSVANARAEADVSAAAAAVTAAPEPVREAEPHNWKMAERWSDHQNGGAPFEARPVQAAPVQAAPMPLAPPATAPQPPTVESDEPSTPHLLEIAGGAFGFAALATILVMIFARRQQRREASSHFALFATTEDPKRRLAARHVDNLRPRLAHADDAPPVHTHDNDHEGTAQEQIEIDDAPPMRPFAPRNMRMDRA